MIWKVITALIVSLSWKGLSKRATVIVIFNSSNLFGWIQAENQAVDEYEANITKLVTRAYIDMSRRKKETAAREHFIEIKRYALHLNPTIFERETSTADLSAQVSVMAAISSQRQYSSNSRGRNFWGSWRGRGRGLQLRSDRKLKTTGSETNLQQLSVVGRIAIRAKSTNSGN